MQSAPYGGEPPEGTYSVDITAEYPEYSSRLLMFFSMFKFILLVPHLVCLGFLAIAVGVVNFLAWWAVLFTGRWPDAFWAFEIGFLRWQVRVNAYLMGLTDQYPPFGLSPGDYPVDVVARYPEQSSRLLMFFRPFKAVLLIPHLICLYGLGLAAAFVGVIAWFAVVFGGRYPQGLWDFMVGVNRWQIRAGAYFVGLSDAYPPFALR